jgi:LPXTG-motif cell wall-anchored protein
MSKNVKIIIIIAIAALVIGLLIYFYKRKKKADELAKLAKEEANKKKNEKPKTIKEVIKAAQTKEPVLMNKFGPGSPSSSPN